MSSIGTPPAAGHTSTISTVKQQGAQGTGQATSQPPSRPSSRAGGHSELESRGGTGAESSLQARRSASVRSLQALSALHETPTLPQGAQQGAVHGQTASDEVKAATVPKEVETKPRDSVESLLDKTATAAAPVLKQAASDPRLGGAERRPPSLHSLGGKAVTPDVSQFAPYNPPTRSSGSGGGLDAATSKAQEKQATKPRDSVESLLDKTATAAAPVLKHAASDQRLGGAEQRPPSLHSLGGKAATPDLSQFAPYNPVTKGTESNQELAGQSLTDLAATSHAKDKQRATQEPVKLDQRAKPAAQEPEISKLPPDKPLSRPSIAEGKKSAEAAAKETTDYITAHPEVDSSRLGNTTVGETIRREQMTVTDTSASSGHVTAKALGDALLTTLGRRGITYTLSNGAAAALMFAIAKGFSNQDQVDTKGLDLAATFVGGITSLAMKELIGEATKMVTALGLDTTIEADADHLKMGQLLAGGFDMLASVISSLAAPAIYAHFEPENFNQDDLTQNPNWSVAMKTVGPAIAKTMLSIATDTASDASTTLAKPLIAGTSAVRSEATGYSWATAMGGMVARLAINFGVPTATGQILKHTGATEGMTPTQVAAASNALAWVCLLGWIMAKSKLTGVAASMGVPNPAPETRPHESTARPSDGNA